MPSLQDKGRKILRWLVQTPGQTFVLCPIAVIGVELALHNGALVFVPWGCLLLVWGYLQYHLVGRYRLPRAGGGWGMEVPPDQIVATGPYRYSATQCISVISFSCLVSQSPSGRGSR